MSGRGHRGERPRGDGSRGPRTSSFTGRPHGALESMLGAITLSDLARRSFGSWPLLLLPVSLLAHQGHLSSWILPWLLLMASIGAAAVLVVAYLPSIFLIHWLRWLVCHRVVALVMATELLSWQPLLGRAFPMRGGAVSCEAALAAALAAAGRGRSCSCVVRSGIWLGFLGTCTCTCTCGLGLAGKTPSENDVKSPIFFRLRRGRRLRRAGVM